MSLKTVQFTITGHPVAKGRARSVLVPKKGGGFAADASGRPIVRHVTPAKTRTWEADARQVARDAMTGQGPFEGPLGLVIVAAFAVPQSWPEWKRAAALRGDIEPTGRPDLDNVVKAAKDACNGIAWIDDSQVIEVRAWKEYGERPGVGVSIVQRPNGGHHASRADVAAALRHAE